MESVLRLQRPSTVRVDNMDRPEQKGDVIGYPQILHYVFVSDSLTPTNDKNYLTLAAKKRRINRYIGKYPAMSLPITWSGLVGEPITWIGLVCEPITWPGLVSEPMTWTGLVGEPIAWPGLVSEPITWTGLVCEPVTWLG